MSRLIATTTGPSHRPVLGWGAAWPALWQSLNHDKDGERKEQTEVERLKQDLGNVQGEEAEQTRPQIRRWRALKRGDPLLGQFARAPRRRRRQPRETLATSALDRDGSNGDCRRANIMVIYDGRAGPALAWRPRTERTRENRRRL